MTGQQPEDPAADQAETRQTGRVAEERGSTPVSPAAPSPSPEAYPATVTPGSTDPVPGGSDKDDTGGLAPAAPTAQIPREDTPGSAGPPAGESATGSPEAATARVEEAPQRFSGSAAVPPPAPKKSRFSRKRDEPQPAQPAAADPWADEHENWATTTPVDPWAFADTPLDTFEPFPEAMPPTRIDGPDAAVSLPPTRHDPAAGLPRTRIEPPAPASAPPGTAPGSPAPGSPAESKPQWWKRKEQPPAAPTANRQPVQPRPPGNASAQRPAAPAPPAPPTRQPSRARPSAPLPPAYPKSAQRPAQPPPRPRRKRHWLRRMFVFSLLSALCCCGVPAYYLWPTAHQYPVDAVLPSSVGDLGLLDSDSSRRALERLRDQLSSTGNWFGDDPFAAVYTDARGKRVTIFGTTGLRITPEADVQAQMVRIADEFNIDSSQAYDLGITGLHERCAVGSQADGEVVVCAWADYGSLATLVFTRRSEQESAELAGTFRDAILQPKFGTDELSGIL